MVSTGGSILVSANDEKEDEKEDEAIQGLSNRQSPLKS